MHRIWHKIETAAYSALCPTSISATSGAVSAEKASFICGRVARTSGHHGCNVVGSVEAMKARKKGDFDPSGTLNSVADLGSEKLDSIGIV
jgi:hypothetical protein